VSRRRGRPPLPPPFSPPLPSPLPHARCVAHQASSSPPPPPPPPTLCSPAAAPWVRMASSHCTSGSISRRHSLPLRRGMLQPRHLAPSAEQAAQQPASEAASVRYTVPFRPSSTYAMLPSALHCGGGGGALVWPRSHWKMPVRCNACHQAAEEEGVAWSADGAWNTAHAPGQGCRAGSRRTPRGPPRQTRCIPTNTARSVLLPPAHKVKYGYHVCRAVGEELAILAPQEPRVLHAELRQDQLCQPKVHVTICITRVHLRRREATPEALAKQL
jgi:hypothetical protein